MKPVFYAQDGLHILPVQTGKCQSDLIQFEAFTCSFVFIPPKGVLHSFPTYAAVLSAIFSRENLKSPDNTLVSRHHQSTHFELSQRGITPNAVSLNLRIVTSNQFADQNKVTITDLNRDSFLSIKRPCL
jgi:hypothetical protein